MTGERISVGAPFFNLTFVPLVVPLLIIVPFGPFLAWKRGDLRAVSERLLFAFGAAILAAIVAAFLAGASHVLALFGVGARLLADRRRALRTGVPGEARDGFPRATACTASPACRARRSARRSPMPRSA